MATVLVLLQALGALAVLVGVALLLPLGGALTVDGALVLVLATSAEVALRRAQNAAGNSRRGPNGEGA